eukprot:2496444-Rhodomonas_salina.1
MPTRTLMSSLREAGQGASFSFYRFLTLKSWQVKNLGWMFLAVPVLLDVGVIILMALIINNFSKSRSYPLYW